MGAEAKDGESLPGSDKCFRPCLPFSLPACPNLLPLPFSTRMQRCTCCRSIEGLPVLVQDCDHQPRDCATGRQAACSEGSAFRLIGACFLERNNKVTTPYTTGNPSLDSEATEGHPNTQGCRRWKEGTNRKKMWWRAARR